MTVRELRQLLFSIVDQEAEVRIMLTDHRCYDRNIEDVATGVEMEQGDPDVVYVVQG